MTSEEVARENYSCAAKAPAHAWAVVMYFYSAVHAVNHDAHGAGEPPKKWEHRERTNHVVFSTTLCKVESKYRALINMAHDARYRATRLPMNERDATKARELATAVLRAAGIRVETERAKDDA